MGSKKKHSSDTKQYKIKRSKKTNKADTIKVKKHPKLKKIILIFVILIFLLVLVGGGVLAGIFFSDQWNITKEELIASGNAEIYDSEEKQIGLLSAGDGNGNRKVISLEQMGKYTPDAYIAIEDKRFYEHSGVDILRTAKATLSYVLHRGSSDVGGGSTITQQLVKNIMKDKADSGTAGMERKIREMSRAYKVESMLTKKQIIEKYLNIIFIGGNDLHGVEYGAQYYFAKSAKDLDLAESAFLAGINDGPNMYNDLAHGLMFVVGTEDMSKGRFIFMCLCPNLILGVIPYILFLIFPQFVGLGLFGIICIGMGFGDYLNIYNAIKQMPKNSKTYLCGMHSYWYL